VEENTTLDQLPLQAAVLPQLVPEPLQSRGTVAAQQLSTILFIKFL
jgi:hypothetical protein